LPQLRHFTRSFFTGEGVMQNTSLVVIFLRGGCDGLTLVAPSGDPLYEAARPPSLRVSRDGEHAGIALRESIADVDFRFHPKAKGLSDLFAARELAVFHAAGLHDATRSHFDAEDRMERAAPHVGASVGGWLARWLEHAKPQGVLTSLAVGSAAPDSLRGAQGIAVAQQINGLRIAPGHGHGAFLRGCMEQMYARDAVLAAPLKRLLSLSREIEARVALDDNGNLRPYVPAVDYPGDNPLAEQLKTVAQAIKLDLGLRVSTVDFGGWDTHINQNWEIEKLIGQLSTALLAFWSDLGSLRKSVLVTVMSEFGRRLKANESGGTDHGHGNVMFTLGGQVKGGRMYGRWPGLDHEALDEGADLAITTDYRTVLAEVVGKHLGANDTADIFPGFDARPLGFLN
jgi:uncharacterized protein (DUF1501 family)